MFQAAQPNTLGADNYLRYCTKEIEGNGSIPACSAVNVANQIKAEANLGRLATDIAAAILRGEAVSVGLEGKTDFRCEELSYSGLIECQSDNALRRAQQSAKHLESLVRQILFNSHDPSRAAIQIVERTSQEACPPPSNTVMCIVTTQVQDQGNLRNVVPTLTTRVAPRPVQLEVDLCPNDLGIQLTLPCPVPPPTDLCPNDLGVQLTLPCPVPPPDETASSGTPPPAETASSGTPPPVTTPRRIKPS